MKPTEHIGDKHIVLKYQDTSEIRMWVGSQKSLETGQEAKATARIAAKTKTERIFASELNCNRKKNDETHNGKEQNLFLFQEMIGDFKQRI